MVEIITREELVEKLENEDAVILLAVFSKTDFEEGHIQGSISMPYGKEFVSIVQKSVKDKDADIVLYGHAKEDRDALNAAKKLEDAGYSNILVYEAGLNDWIEAGQSTEGI
jgi:rhodanese-related sulfurtransferase